MHYKAISQLLEKKCIKTNIVLMNFETIVIFATPSASRGLKFDQPSMLFLKGFKA
jgi:hypothetical protein